ncbi:fasciclin domain-containing protein [Portibacter marinus]|uniref:fasciclin domain-containing protein n=1 Tax=Portibacter marinus TaxID=2898660 RepID=UPI001F2CE8A2|nr:fasciclin domain-containing protein [Portibacter marinus]
MQTRTLFFSLCLAILTFQLSAQHSYSNQKNSQAKTVSYQNPSDIVDIAASNDQFSTLVAAVKAAGLVETLKSEGPFTVFAPVNAAFSKLPEGTVSTLLKPESKDKLTKILTYHVVAGEFFAKDIINAISSSGGAIELETVYGDKIVAKLVNGSVIITDETGGKITVTSTDVEASNGVIHVIDSVLMPQ